MEILPVTRRLVRWLVRCGSATTLVLVVTSAFGQDFKYTINNGTITITGYTGIGGSVAIPDEIGGLPVTVIGYRAFVSTPVTDVTIPQSVTNIGGSAFLGCEGLTNLTMANGVTSVEGNAFAECWGLSVVRIPASVTSIGENAFFDCHGLQAFAVDGQNSAYCSVNGVLFNKSQSTLVQCPETRAGVYTIPNGVTKIGSSAFNSCFRLTEVSMGDGIVDIGDHAFADCSGLTNVVLPESVITIGFRAFYYCRSLRNITMSSNVASIGESGFGMCTSLAGITIPGSVTNIGAQAFSYCSDLKAITVDALNSAYSSVDGVLFDKSQTTLIQYPGGKTGSYTVPDLVRSVGDYAFSYCFGLTTVTIPNSVTNLGYFAFYQCRWLTNAYFQGDAPSSRWEMPFGGPDNLGEDPVTIYYLPGTTGWLPWVFGRPAVLWQPQVQAADSGFGIGTNGFGFFVTWSSGKTLVVEAATNLANPAWVPLSTNILSNGSVYFSDPQWANHPGRFYRVRGL